MQRKAIIACGLCLLIGAAVPLIAQDTKTQQPTEEEKAMMEAFAKLATPGEHHAHLRPMTGNWNCAGKFRMAPEAPWQTFTSTSQNEWMFGGRFLTTKVKGEPMFGSPEPFEGFSILGYDNGNRKYQSSWIDNMGTMIMTSEGDSDPSGRVITFRGECFCPERQKNIPMRTVYTIQGDNAYKIEMYSPDDAGKEYVGMEITCTKKRGA